MRSTVRMAQLIAMTRYAGQYVNPWSAWLNMCLFIDGLALPLFCTAIILQLRWAACLQGKRRRDTHRHAHGHTRAQAYTNSHTLTHTYTNTRTHTITQKHTHTHTHTHTRAHTHTHTHTHRAAMGALWRRIPGKTRTLSLSLAWQGAPCRKPLKGPTTMMPGAASPQHLR